MAAPTNHRRALLVATFLAAVAGAGQAHAAGTDADRARRLAQAPSDLGRGATTDGWRLVRTPNPRGGADAVSIMRTAELSGSDIGLAGLMVRCAEHGTAVLVIMVAPLPPRAHPQVILRASDKEARFEAIVTPPGAALLLPPEADVLLTGSWQAMAELWIEVVSEGSTVRGHVSLAGYRTARAGLAANCPAP